MIPMETYSELFSLSLRGKIAAIFSRQGVTPSESDWAALRGERDFSMRDLARISHEAGLDIQIDFIERHEYVFVESYDDVLPCPNPTGWINGVPDETQKMAYLACKKPGGEMIAIVASNAGGTWLNHLRREDQTAGVPVSEEIVAWAPYEG